jgi:GT2 family glycosyltransferase
VNINSHEISPIDVSVIIINYNTCDLLRECLSSVVRDSTLKEIIVIDNASTDGSVQMVKTEFSEVVLRINDKNERFAKPNNTAISIARGRYLFLLNSDAFLYSDTIQKLVRYADDHPDVGVVAPQLLYPDGTIQPSCRGYFTLWSHFFDMCALDKIFPKSKIFAKSEMSYFDHKSLIEVDHVMAAAILVRREVINDVGMFDENLTIIYNDLDWSMRIKKKGWKIIFYPEAQALHHHSKTMKMMNRQFELFPEIQKNAKYFFKKHHGKYWMISYNLLAVFGFFFRIIYWFIRSLFEKSENTKYTLIYSWKKWVNSFQNYQ